MRDIGHHLREKNIKKEEEKEKEIFSRVSQMDYK